MADKAHSTAEKLRRGLVALPIVYIICSEWAAQHRHWFASGDRLARFALTALRFSYPISTELEGCHQTWGFPRRKQHLELLGRRVFDLI